jgi:brefeldin A-inhibited guanine nucleotide-exchange protein
LQASSVVSSKCLVITVAGLSKLASDPRSAIRKSALEVLFNILNDHGHLFSRSFWITVFNSVIFPIFSGVSDKKDVKDQDSSTSASPHTERSTWDSETSAVAVQCLVDLFVSFFNVIRSQLQSIVSILMGFVRSPVKGPASTGVASLLRLAGELGSRISEDEWREIFLALKEAAASLLPGFMKVLRIMDDIEMPESPNLYADVDAPSDHGFTNDDLPDDNLQTAAYVISRVKSHIAVQLLIVQVLSLSHSRSLTHTDKKLACVQIMLLHSTFDVHASMYALQKIYISRQKVKNTRCIFLCVCVCVCVCVWKERRSYPIF